MLPQLIKRRCPALADMCKAIVACPTGAIYFVADEQERVGGKIVFHYEKCDGCGQCAAECCGSAIEMKEAV